MTEPRPDRYWRWVLGIVVLGLALHALLLQAGFGMDDYAQLAMLHDAYPVKRQAWDLFSFSRGTPPEVQALMDRGSLAWWSFPALKLSALRPLSSLLMWLDVKLFGTWTIGHHLHSFVWWSAMLGAAALLLRRLLPPRWALLALLLYALDECHVYPIGWLANRNALVAATFSMLALWAHVRHREDGWARGRVLAPAMLLLAFLGGEYALCILPFFVLYELLAAPGERAARARALLPMLAVFVAYVLVHRSLGFGSFGSNVYVDPIREPLAYLGRAMLRVPILLADMFMALPTGKASLTPERQQLQAWLGPVALLLIVVLARAAAQRRPQEQRARLWWLLLASTAAVLPVASSFVSARLLLIPAVGGHAVVAAVLLDAWDRIRAPQTRRRALTIVQGVVATALLFGHTLLATYWSLEEQAAMVRLNVGTRQASMMMQVDDKKVSGQRLVVLSVGDPMSLLYPPTVRWLNGRPMPRSWWVLSMAPHPHLLTRTAPDTIELSVVGGSMLSGPVEQLFRRPSQPLRVGDEVHLDGMRVRILGVDPKSRPNRVEYRFDAPVDDPSIVFLLCTRKGLIRYPMGPVGVPLPIPPPKLPLVLDIDEQDRRGAAN